MTHIQNPVQNWLDSLAHLPDYSIVKAFSGAWLKEAKERWAALGRDPKKLYTCLRYYTDVQFASDDYGACKAWWQQHFPKFLDKTYFDQYLPHVDLIETLNEHTDDDMTRNPARLRPHLNTEQAACAVFAETYRGKLLPDDVRLVIVNGPVGNSIAREFYDLALDTDNVLGYHSYEFCMNGQRDPGSWRFHSGRWYYDELIYDRRPRYAFTEAGPYWNTAEGWRHPHVLGGDENKLVAVMKQFWTDMTTTPAYAEGRLFGAGCYFTSGGGEGWKWYELLTPQLIKLADALRPMWKPGVYAEMDKTKVLAELDKIDAATAAIRAEVGGQPANWWDAWPQGDIDPARKLKATGRTVVIYKADGVTRLTARAQTSQWDVFARNGDLLKVYDGDPGGWWVWAKDVEPA